MKAREKPSLKINYLLPGVLLGYILIGKAGRRDLRMLCMIAEDES